MLKITYTEKGLYLERLTTSLETWISSRVLVCLRAATSLYVEPSTASLLLPIDLPYFQNIEALKGKNSDLLQLSVCDEYSVEITLKGTWVTTDEDTEDGVFVCNLEDQTEFFIYQLWKEGNLDTSLIGE